MLNPFKKFERMIAGSPLTIVTVRSHNSDGTSTVETVGGGSAIVEGQGVAVDSKAYVQGGEIKREAPSLPYYEIEV